jgi:hypothetical protein
MTEFAELIAHDKIAQKWSVDAQKNYQSFSQYLTQNAPLSIKIGNGGLSFYKMLGTQKVFVCHFNAEPRKGQVDIGFADFRFDALQGILDVEKTLQAMQAVALPDVKIKVNKLWCSFHFPMNLIQHVAGLFVEHIIDKALIR